ncbi:hypothetical protein ABPG74_020714 [Tetrahymena malaccensis]
MNLCKCSLSDWIQKNKSQIDDILFLHYANQIIDGLEYLHNKEYVLRDLSVRNILISTEGVIKLCDFGLAKKYDTILKSDVLYTQSPKGVYFYFPPELHEDFKNQKPKLKQTKKGDIWALGVCLSLLGGVKIDKFFKVNQEDFEIPKSKYLSEKANELIKFILNRNPEERPTINQIRERIFDVFLNIPDQKIDDNKILSNQSQNQIENLGDQPNLQNQQNSFESQQPFKVERILDFNFALCNKLYQKYQKQESQYQNNIDFLLTLGFLECKFNSNYTKAQELFEKVLDLDENEIDAYIGLCECIMWQADYSKFSKILIYSEICLNKDQFYWRALYFKSLYFYNFSQYQKSLENLEKIQLDQFDYCQALSLKLLVLNEIKDDGDKSELIDKIISSNKNNDPIVYLRLGIFYERQNELQKAQHFCQKCLEFSPNQLFSLSYCSYIQRQDKIASEKIILKAQQLYPNSSFVFIVKQYLEEDDDKKLDLLNQALELDSQNYNALGEIGDIKKQQKQFKESIQYFEKALVIKPDDLYYHHMIAKIYGFELNEYQKAIDIYKKCIKINPNELNYFEELTKIYQIQNNYIENEKIVRDNLQISNKVQKLYFLLSKIEYYYDHYDLFVQYINKAIELDPNDINCLVSYMFYFLNDKKDNKKAREYVIQINKLDPNYSSILFYFAITEIDQEKKIQYYKQFLEKYTKHEESLKSLGNCYFQQQKYEDALKYYQQAFSINKSIVNSNNITTVLIKLKLYGQAQEQSTQSLHINQQNYITHKLQGDIYSERKQHKEAIESFEMVILYNQNYTQIFKNIALQYEQLNNLNEALKYYQKHVQYYPNDPHTLFKIGFLQYKINNDIKKAILYYKKSIELNPSNNAKCYKQLGILYKKQQEYELAKENFLIAIEQDDSEQDLYWELFLIEKQYFFNIQNYEYYEEQFHRYQNQQIKQIEQYRQENNIQEARQLIKNFLNNYPENDQGYFQCGLIEFSDKNFDQAIVYFLKCCQNEYQVGESAYNIGLCYINLNNYKKAVEFYLKAIRQKKSIDLHYQIGKIFITKLNSPQQAIKFLRKSLELKVQNKLTHYFLGRSFEKINYISDAVESFTKYLQQNPDLDVEYCKNYIKKNQNTPKKQYKYKDFEDSDSDLEDNIEILQQAEQQMQKGNLIQSIQNYEKAVDYNPTTKSQMKLGYAYLKNFQIQNAASIFENIMENKLFQLDQYENILQQYIQLNQFQLGLDFFYGKAKKYEKQNKFENAIIIYKFILNKEENYIEAMYNIGLIYYKQERIKESLEILFQVVKKNPEFQLAYFEIGSIQLSIKKNPKQAIKFLRRSIELNPNHVDSLFRLGQAFELRKYNYEALQCYYKQQQLSPNYNQIYIDQFIKLNKDTKVKKYKQTKIEDSDCNIF